jgi:hypothetical protein
LTKTISSTIRRILASFAVVSSLLVRSARTAPHCTALHYTTPVSVFVSVPLAQCSLSSSSTTTRPGACYRFHLNPRLLYLCSLSADYRTLLAVVPCEPPPILI